MKLLAHGKSNFLMLVHLSALPMPNVAEGRLEMAVAAYDWCGDLWHSPCYTLLSWQTRST